MIYKLIVIVLLLVILQNNSMPNYSITSAYRGVQDINFLLRNSSTKKIRRHLPNIRPFLSRILYSSSEEKQVLK